MTPACAGAPARGSPAPTPGAATRVPRGQRMTETAMTRRLISTGSPFERDFAYSRAVVDGDWCFVAGTTGYDYAAMEMPQDPADQATNAFVTIRRTLTEAGFAMEDIVKVTYMITEADLRHAIAPAICAALGEIRPASTMLVAGLVEPEMKVEIEVIAKRRGSDGETR